MLINLHVKNLALIDEADICFDDGLNIFTGETGAGKSILLGSVNLALGAKASRDMIGKHGDYASVELLFQVDDECVRRLQQKDISVEDHQVLISRKFTENRNIMKINGENVTLAMVRQITPLLIDIHGQHEHQSLLYPANHLAILDRFGKKEMEKIKEELSGKYEQYRRFCSELKEFTMDGEERRRTMDFLEFEINEIEAAQLLRGEDEELEQRYRRAKNSRRIATELAEARECLESDSHESVSELVSRAYRALSGAVQLDEGLEAMVGQLADIEGLVNDLNRDMTEYLSELEFDGGEYAVLEERLDLINNLKAKHGGSLESIETALEEKKQKLDFLKEYEANRQRIIKERDGMYEQLVALSGRLTAIRKKTAAVLQKQIRTALLELNFLSVEFEINFEPLEEPTANGMDHAEYLISLNPGEAPKPLAKVASGGELSRIMLAIKTVLADKDEIGTLIFDEIDAGISGRTAQMVADKLKEIGKSRQVLCITHLPQIAAMAEKHFCINKDVVDNLTVTSIKELDEEGSVMELARLLGGMNLTEAVVSNARELKALAAES